MQSRRDTRNLKYVGASVPLEQRGYWDPEFDDWDYVFAPHSSFGYVVHGQIYHELMQTPTFSRLRYVSQLGTTFTHPFFVESPGTRADHSLLAAVLGEVVGDSINLNQADVDHLVVSLLFHDSAITPFSDFGNPRAPYTEEDPFSEELNIGKVLVGDVLEVFRKYKIDRERVIETVRGKGDLGFFVSSKGNLDLDRISYTIYDYFNMIGRNPYGSFKKVLRPDLFDIDLDIEVNKGGLVFVDSDRLARFLHLRALMFERVYYDPNNKAKEAFFRRRLRELLKAGKLKPENFKGTDAEFMAELKKVMDPMEYRDFFQTNFYPFREVGRRYGTTLESLSNPKDDGVVMEESRGFDPATKTLVKTEGSVKKVRVVDERCKEIERVAREQVYVGFYKKDDSLPEYIDPEFLEEFKANPAVRDLIEERKRVLGG